ncbi:hypothetical protein [Roseibium sp. RKSG952]|uniref:hypothetical protein n=1 Tax=Roseibium sp. RKSG952 TaxID=2529384 RepID=UPI0012BC008C|nr:hypothetical protein [Roseibium sp. RKSG952]MTH95401.1 hypothetical protein [Roseibium sp. RKSG952]
MTATNIAYTAEEIRDRFSKLRDLKIFARAITLDPALADSLSAHVRVVSNQAYPLDDLFSIYVELLSLKESITPNLKRRSVGFPSVTERAANVLHKQYGRSLDQVSKILGLPKKSVSDMIRR